MSTVRVEQVRNYLKITHTDDDVELQELIDGAEDEALQFLDRDELPRRGQAAVDELDSNQPEPVSDSDDLAPVVRMAIYLLVQGMYEAKDATEMAAVRTVAERKLMPYRNRLGV